MNKEIYLMLKRRGYDINEDIITSPNEQFLLNKIDSSDRIFLFFPPASQKVGVNIIRQYIKEMKDNNVTRAILIVKDSITAFAKQAFDKEKELTFEYFNTKEFLFDKLSHVLVPKHELISQEEKKELLNLYKIKEINLPKMLSSDTIARYFGASKGSVFKITRTSETGGEYIYYRIVI